MKGLTIVSKAWTYSSEKHLDGIPYDPKDAIARGETLSKAKYSLFKTLWDLGCFIDFIGVCREFKFSRYPDEDLVRIPLAPVFETLTDKQRHIIGHANGNNSKEPGFRDYYCTTNGCPDCEHLVSMGLMLHGREIGGITNSRYYILTEAGKIAALSDAVITRGKSETIFKPWVPHLVNKDGFISLEMFKANADLVNQFKGIKCHIFSAEWGYYWRERCAGYCQVNEAGVYEFEEAFQSTHHCGSEKQIWFKLLINESGEVAA